MYRTNAYEAIKIEKAPVKWGTLILSVLKPIGKGLKLVAISLLGLIAVVLGGPGIYYVGKFLAFHVDGRPTLAIFESRFDPIYWCIGAIVCIPLFFSYHIGKKIISQFS